MDIQRIVDQAINDVIHDQELQHLREWQLSAIEFMATITHTTLTPCDCGSPDCPPKFSEKAVEMLREAADGGWELVKTEGMMGRLLIVQAREYKRGFDAGVASTKPSNQIAFGD